MSAATFVCPHCGHTYPIKPALIDKAVRCTACKNAFRLRADGIAERVSVAAPAPAQAPVAPTPAPTAPAQTPAPAPVAAAPAKPAAANPAPNVSAPAPVPATAAAIAPITPAPPKAVPPADQPATPPVSTQRISPATPRAGMTRQQEEARRQMAESLRSAMGSLADEELDLGEAPTGGSALSSNKPGSKDSDRLAKADPKRSSERLTKPKTQTERNKRSSSFLKAKDGKQAGKGPAILTGEGEREAAIQRRWQLGFAAFIVVALLCAFLLTRTSSRGAAVTAFTSELAAPDLRYGARIPAIQKRAWLPEVTPFIDLPDPRLGRVEEVPATAIADALTKLNGLTWVPGAERWVSRDKVDWVTRQLSGDPTGVAKILEKSGVVQVSRKAMREQLNSANLSEASVDLVDRLLTSPLATQLASHPPSTLRWCTVSGRKGTYIRDPGQGYQFPTGDYQGELLQLTGDGWDGAWKFFSLTVATPGK